MTPTAPQTFAAGLALDPQSRQCGYDDAVGGRSFAPPHGCDVLAYAAGRVEGETLRGAIPQGTR